LVQTVEVTVVELTMVVGPATWVVTPATELEGEDLAEVTDPVADVAEEEEPEMWNGKEYWKIVESESRVILNP